MALSLNLKFVGEDKDLSVTFPYANSSATGTQVKDLMETIIDNGDVFVSPPLGILDASFVDRTVTPIVLG
ncbi:hypothetical protein AGMMS50276_13990 [Synergistales bacterium]|nr:hypothetical protein AGMMS50276_13990 [Synergistales bacterium]